jgi:Ca-activated chloride channel homolog
MTFEWPYVLIALIVIPLLLGAYVWHNQQRDKRASAFTNPALLPNLVERPPGWRRHLPLAIVLVALAALIVGVARPHATVSVKRETATVVMAIDTSRSMKATDLRPSRLAVARATAERFAAEVPRKYRIAVIAFASRAVVALPPTTDRALVSKALASLRPGQGTALGDAIMLATRISQRAKENDGNIPPEAMLVISDGAAQGGRVSPPAAIAKARQAHIPISAVVLGTPGGVVNDTVRGGYRVSIQVPPNPGLLRAAATATGGEVFQSPFDQKMSDVYERLSSRLGHRDSSRELGDFFAGGAVLLLLVGGLLSSLWFRRIP